ncbi:hypothetical protein C8R47DRAFT_1063221 [Mycena vitilis]|nr:hypothetical protein C8R47DRAFT_1063221 [Mycena vitilis]
MPDVASGALVTTHLRAYGEGHDGVLLHSPLDPARVPHFHVERYAPPELLCLDPPRAKVGNVVVLRTDHAVKSVPPVALVEGKALLAQEGPDLFVVGTKTAARAVRRGVGTTESGAHRRKRRPSKWRLWRERSEWSAANEGRLSSGRRARCRARREREMGDGGGEKGRWWQLEDGAKTPTSVGRCPSVVVYGAADVVGVGREQGHTFPHPSLSLDALRPHLSSHLPVRPSSLLPRAACREGPIFQSRLAHTAMCVIMSTSALESSRGRWHSGLLPTCGMEAICDAVRGRRKRVFFPFPLGVAIAGVEGVPPNAVSAPDDVESDAEVDGGVHADGDGDAEADGDESSSSPHPARLWRVELELPRGNLEAANDALRLNQSSPDVLTSRVFLSGRLPQALQHAQSALRGDPGHEPAQRMRGRRGRRGAQDGAQKGGGGAQFELVLLRVRGSPRLLHRVVLPLCNPSAGSSVFCGKPDRSSVATVAGCCSVWQSRSGFRHAAGEEAARTEAPGLDLEGQGAARTIVYRALLVEMRPFAMFLRHLNTRSLRGVQAHWAGILWLLNLALDVHLRLRAAESAGFALVGSIGTSKNLCQSSVAAAASYAHDIEFTYDSKLQVFGTDPLLPVSHLGRVGFATLNAQSPTSNLPSLSDMGGRNGDRGGPPPDVRSERGTTCRRGCAPTKAACGMGYVPTKATCGRGYVPTKAAYGEADVAPKARQRSGGGDVRVGRNTDGGDVKEGLRADKGSVREELHADKGSVRGTDEGDVQWRQRWRAAMVRQRQDNEGAGPTCGRGKPPTKATCREGKGDVRAGQNDVTGVRQGCRADAVATRQQKRDGGPAACAEGRARLTRGGRRSRACVTPTAGVQSGEAPLVSSRGRDHSFGVPRLCLAVAWHHPRLARTFQELGGRGCCVTVLNLRANHIICKPSLTQDKDSLSSVARHAACMISWVTRPHPNLDASAFAPGVILAQVTV